MSVICSSSHDFTIRGFSLTKRIGGGIYKASHVFTAGGYDWIIHFFPDGGNLEDRSSYCSVFLVLASDGSEVRALFEVTLLDQTGNGQHLVFGHFSHSPPCTLNYRGHMM